MRIYWLNPPLTTRALYADIGWMNFNTACKQYDWVQPIIDWSEYHTVDNVVAHILESEVSVLMVSTYTWNHILISKVCDQIKQLHPEIIIIRGGPQQGYNEKFFEDNPSIDYLCYSTGYGEEFIQAALPQIEQHGKIVNEESVPWLISRTHHAQIVKRKYEFPTESAIEHNIHYVAEVFNVAKDKNIRYGVQYETSRGCPYQCTYCEWGSGGTGAKVSQKPLSVINKDIELLSTMGIKDFEIIDANFGIFPRDIEILNTIVESRKLFNAPENLMLYGLAKVRAEKKEKILDVMFENGLMDYYFMSVQSGSQEVLDNVKRTDITLEDNLRLASKYRTMYGIPVKVELILGLPGSTLDVFYYEMDLIQKFGGWVWPRAPFSILPDTEAAGKLYQRLHKIKTSKIGVPENDENEDKYISDSVIIKYRSYQEIVTESYSFSTEDWKEMFFMNRAQKVLGPMLKEDQQASVVLRNIFKQIKVMPWYEEVDRELSRMVSGDRKDEDSGLINGRLIEEYIQDHVTEIQFVGD